jgi:hypothetical protein
MIMGGLPIADMVVEVETEDFAAPVVPFILS